MWYDLHYLKTSIIDVYFSMSRSVSRAPTCSSSPSQSGSIQDSDSLMSCDSTGTSFTGNSYSRSLAGFPGLNFKMPEKLQIVKPIEGKIGIKHL